MYKINKQKCTGCGVCMANCPGATELEAEGKAKVKISPSARTLIR